MAINNLIGISDALAATAAPSTNGGLASFIPMMLIFLVGMYFLMIRPQQKRIKAHRQLLAELSKGDEIVTAGGLVGKIAKLSDDFISLTIAENVDINIQKSAITQVLPKGTIKTLQ